MDSTYARRALHGRRMKDEGLSRLVSGRDFVWIVLLEQELEEPRQGGVDGVVAAAVRGQQADVGGFV